MADAAALVAAAPPAKRARTLGKEDISEAANKSNKLPGKPVQEKELEKDRVEKRADYLCWDDYFMSVAFLSAQRSKDPNTQVGACIANQDKRIVGIGYNGMPCGCSDDELPWKRSAKDKNGLDTKYMYVVHAEANAILNKNCESLKGCTMYVALFPCNECTKLIIQSGIKRVVYYSDKYKARAPFQASRRMLEMAKVECVQYTPSRSKITIDFSVIEDKNYDVPTPLRAPGGRAGCC